jgi:hypothetical protein
MNEEPRRAGRPLVVTLCTVPLLQEGLAVALGEIADLQAFPANGGDTVGLLRVLQPDAVVVDDADEAEAAATFADETRLPILHISLQDRTMRILRNGGWQAAGNARTSPEDLRNLLIASVLARGEGL